MNLNDKTRSHILKRLAKAGDSTEKADAFDDVEWEDRGPVLLALIRDGSINIGEDPHLWELFADEHQHVTADDLLLLLLGAAKVPRNFVCPHLPFWPRELDKVCMHVALRPDERAKLLAALGDLPKKMRVGLAWCLARFGEPVGKAVGNQATALARQDAIDEAVPWPAGDGGLQDRRIWDPDTRKPTAAFTQLLELLTTPQKYEEALYKRVIKQATKLGDRPAQGRWHPAPLAPVFRRASESEWPLLVRSLHGGRAGLQARLEERDDIDGEGWMRIAAALAQDAAASHAIATMRDTVVAFAVTRFAATGAPVPDSVVEALRLDDGSDGLHRWDNELNTAPLDAAGFDAAVRYAEQTDCYPGLEPLFDALAQLDDAQRKCVVASALERAPDTAYPYLQLIDDAELIEQAIDSFEARVMQPRRAAFGLGHLDARWLPRLAQAADAAEDERAVEALRQAVLVVLAREIDAGHTTDPDHDRFVRPHLGRSTPRCRAFEKLVLHLPVERAEPIMKQLIASANVDVATRAIVASSLCWTRDVRAALVERLVRDARALSPDAHWLSLGLKLVPGVSQIIAEVTRRDPTTALDWCFGATMGRDEHERLKASISAGQPTDAVARLRRSAEAAGGNERIYALRLLDGPDAGSLNRVGGLPPGSWAGRWPERDGLPMTHLLTLDLKDVPGGDFGADRALTLFCANPRLNYANTPGTDYTAVVFSSAGQVSASTGAPHEVPTLEERAFSVVEVRVPADMWTNPEHGDLKADDAALAARVLGPPSWIQDDEYLGRFIMQFDADFCPINLGDAGRMYVFDAVAFWQCC